MNEDNLASQELLEASNVDAKLGSKQEKLTAAFAWIRDLLVGHVMRIERLWQDGSVAREAAETKAQTDVADTVAEESRSLGAMR